MFYLLVIIMLSCIAVLYILYLYYFVLCTICSTADDSTSYQVYPLELVALSVNLTCDPEFRCNLGVYADAVNGSHSH